MSSRFYLYVGNDNLVWLGDPDTLEGGLRNAATGEYINSATVGVTLIDSDGVEVDGETWPKSLSYIAASNGMYRAALSDAVELVAGAEYTAKISADGGPGLLGYWELPVKALTRAR